jgi:hypothetical protein
MSYGVVATKHHDGFAVWPTRYGSQSVMNSGKNDAAPMKQSEHPLGASCQRGYGLPARIAVDEAVRSR